MSTEVVPQGTGTQGAIEDNPEPGSTAYKIKYRKGQKKTLKSGVEVLICGAKTRAGHPCRSTALGPAGRCRVHNGWPLTGTEVGTYKHGRYSKLLPSRLVPRYHASLDDPDLLSLKEEIALIDSRIGDLTDRVDSGESSMIWDKLNTARNKYLKAMRDDNQEGAVEALNDLLELAGRGKADFAIWKDMENLVKTRKQLVESERKRLVQMNQMITAEQAVVLVSAIVHTLKGVVYDRCDASTARDILDAVSADTARLLDRPVNHWVNRAGEVSVDG